jgi:hypothetical protein
VSAGRLALGLLLALGALGPAGRPDGGRLVPHPRPPIFTVDGASPEAAALVRRMALVLQHDLGLPLPARITARLYDGRARFAQGLVTHAAVSAPRAAELARFAVGATIPGSLLLVAPAPSATPSIDWPRLVAHELTHLAQHELAGVEAGPAQWLAEGMAEWVAYEMLDRLGLAGRESRHATARAAAAEYIRLVDGLDLDALTTAEGFLAGHQRAGTLRTYRLVLHLADRLVTEHGFAALVGYFRAFRVSSDPGVNFRACFGRPVDAFEQAVLARLTAGQPAVKPSRVAS